jgi:hypothetical protein
MSMRTMNAVAMKTEANLYLKELDLTDCYPLTMVLILEGIRLDQLEANARWISCSNDQVR